MRKSFISITISAMLCFILFLFAGCSNTAKEVSTITDIELYSDMKSEAEKIEVKFDNNSGKYFEFTIENKNEIADIMNIVINDKLNNLGKGAVAPGNNTSFTIYQGEKAYGVSLRGVEANGNRYGFSSTELQSKITDLAIAQGAYDTEVGVIYKVIDLQDSESVEEEKITVADKTAILALLENSYSDCEYFYLYDSRDLAEQYYSSSITENELAAYQYKDTVTTGKDELLLMYHIYQNYNETTYYITSPSKGEYVDNGNTMNIDLAFGLWHNYYLNIYVVS